MTSCFCFRKPLTIRPQRHESVKLFVQEPSHCFKCDRLYVDGFTFHTCHHTICLSCTYVMYIIDNTKCPVCNTTLDDHDFTRFKKQYPKFKYND